MKRLLIVVLVIVVTLGLVVGIVYHQLSALPASPDEIDRQWAEVERLGASDPACQKSSRHLYDAVRQWDRIPPKNRMQFRDTTFDISKASKADLDRLQKALSSLNVWSERGGGVENSLRLPTRVGDPEIDVMQLLSICRVALKTASNDPDDPQVTAVLRVSWLLQECGGYLEGLVGYAILEAAVKRQQKKNIPPSKAFFKYSPSRKKVLSIFARTALEEYRLAVATLDDENFRSNDGIFPCRSLDHCVLRFTPKQNELLRIKLEQAAFVKSLEKASPDFSKMERVLVEADSNSKNSGSTLFRMFPPGYRSMREVLNKIDGIIKTHKSYIDQHSP